MLVRLTALQKRHPSPWGPVCACMCVVCVVYVFASCKAHWLWGPKLASFPFWFGWPNSQLQLLPWVPLPKAISLHIWRRGKEGLREGEKPRRDSNALI